MGASIVLIIIGVIFLVVVGGLVLWLVGAYNSLVRAKNAVENAWAQIDVQLKRRHDLIPNLVETAKGYMEHERGTFEAVTKARNLAQNADSVGERSKAEGQLDQAMSNFFLVVENYPDLKANQNFLSLQEELTSTENKIGFARQYYNDSAMQFNNKIHMFPSNLVAGTFNFSEAEYFEIEEEAEREAPEVSFS